MLKKTIKSNSGYGSLPLRAAHTGGDRRRLLASCCSGACERRGVVRTGILPDNSAGLSANHRSRRARAGGTERGAACGCVCVCVCAPLLPPAHPTPPPPCPRSPLSSLREIHSTPWIAPICPLFSPLPPCPRSPLSSLREIHSTPWTNEPVPQKVCAVEAQFIEPKGSSIC